MLNLSKEMLKQLYWMENLSANQIGEKFGASESAVLRRMIKYEIPRRTQQQAKGKRPIPKREIENLYWGERLSIEKVAQKLGIATRTLVYWMNKYSILTRSLSEAQMGKTPWNKGIPRSDEVKRRLSEFRRGKKLPPETRKKIALALRGGKQSNETKIKISESRKSRAIVPWNKGRPCPYIKEVFLKNREKRLRALCKKPTKPEKLFANLVRKLGLSFRYTGNGTFWIGDINPDFVECNGKKIAVEVFGDYWHSPLLNPNIRYSSTYGGRKKILSKYGWKLIVFWGSELKSSRAEGIVLKRLGGVQGW